VHTDHTPEIYKVDTPILRTLLSSFILNNISFLWGKLLKVYFKVMLK